MTTVADILQYIETLAPSAYKESWDRCGLNCGHSGRCVTKVLVALDPFAEVCREAKDFGAELLVTHHTLLWEPGFVTDQDTQGRNALFLIENGIAHINAHTNLDLAPEGVGDVLARTLRLSDISIIDPAGVDSRGREWGLVRRGTVPEQSLDTFLSTVKARLGCGGLRYVSGGKPVHRVAVGGGACGDEIGRVAAAGCDTFVTSDLKYNQFWEARELGLNLIDAGHFYTENPVCTWLAEEIAGAFPEIQVRVSRRHRDCMKFFC